MVTYLDAIELGHLKEIIRHNGLDGRFFLSCTLEDLQGVDITNLQRKKITMFMPL